MLERRRLTRLILLGLAVAGLAYLSWPRTASLRTFSPEAMGRLETAMWRDYYDHRYVALFLALYRVNREQYGFSPWDSVRVAFLAAKAARVFQPSTNRAQAEAATPWLRRYYGIIRARSHEPFDVDKAARSELTWWQLRREDASPEEYGKVVAQVAQEVYGTHDGRLEQASQVRAAMMDYRDRHSEGRMAEQDWYFIEQNLRKAFALLKQGVTRSP
jgi:hypothetical protein